MKIISLKLRPMLGIAVGTVLLAACSSAPMNNAKLDDARAAYQRAAADPLVVRSAPLDLRQAQQALLMADSAFTSGSEVSDVDHYAYLARQRTEVAVLAGKIAAADQSVEASRAKRDRIIIEARTREVDTQRLSADQARMSAEQAKMRADQAKMEAESAQKLADERLAAAEAARKQAEAAKARNAALQAELAELQAKDTDRGMVLTLGDVLFDTAKSSLKAGALRSIDKLAEFLKRNPERKILIEGHTDSVGSDEYNQQLSQARAAAVRQALLENQIAADRLDMRGLGEAYPVANNATAAGRQQNRRVEVIFSDEAGQVKARSN